jgi:hypothetical protein
LILLFELGQALGRISAFALIKLHPRMPFRSRKKYAGAACVAAAKNPVQSSRPGSSRSFGEYALLEDSGYMSQERYFAAAITRKTLDSSVAYCRVTTRRRGTVPHS